MFLANESKSNESDNLRQRRQLLQASLLVETTLSIRLISCNDLTLNKVLLCLRKNRQQTAIHPLESGRARNDICFTPCGIDPDTGVNGALEIGRFWK
jgi:hypothetical protein